MLRFTCSSRSAVIGFAVGIMLFTLCALSFATNTDQCVAYQINSRHDGCVTTDKDLKPPLLQKWTLNLGGIISYPLIADGEIFVTVGNDDDYGTKLYAITAKTGNIAWGPVDIGGESYWSAATYGDGRVYVVDGDGDVRAFAASNGRQAWQSHLGETYGDFCSPPTFYGGMLYLSGDDTLFGLNAATGKVVWSQPVKYGDISSPVVTDDGVYVTYAGGMSYKFDPVDGNNIWTYDTGCAGGGGKTSVLYQNRLYSRDHCSDWSGFVLNATTGAYIGGYRTDRTPAFYDGHCYLVRNFQLERKNISDMKTEWTCSSISELMTPPLIVNGYVYVGNRQGMLYAINPKDGQVVWSSNTGAEILYADEQNACAPVAAMGAGEGILVVPASDLLVCYTPMNHSPVVDCSTPIQVECSSPTGSSVQIKAHVSDVDGGPLTVKWSVDGQLVKQDKLADSGETASTLSLTRNYALGKHTVSVEVTDLTKASTKATTTVTVADTIAPRIVIRTLCDTLMPSNGRMMDVGFGADVVDAVDAKPTVQTFVYSNQDDVVTKSTVQLSPDAILSPKLMLRQECDPKTNGRVYLIVVKASDASGNSSFACSTVIVPRSSSRTLLNLTQAQARQAVQTCQKSQGNRPAGYYVVGDGPQIGPK